MDMTTILLSVIIFCAAIMLFLLMYMHVRKKARNKRTGRQMMATKRELIPSSVYTRLFAWCDKFWLSKQELRRLTRRIEEMSIYSLPEARIMAIKLYAVATLVIAAIILFAMFAFKDIFMMSVFMLLAIVLKDSLINKQFDKIYLKMHIQLDDALSSLSQAYVRTWSVTEALQEIETGPLLTKQFTELAAILTSVDMERRLEEFYISAPIKSLQTLAGVCQQINNSGEDPSTRRNNEQSNFTKSLSDIQGEIKFEIQKLALQGASFGTLEYLPVVPLFFIAPIDWFLGSTIPGTRVLYDGMFGFVVRIVAVVLATGSYSLISKMNSPMVITFDDRKIWVIKLMKRVSVQKFIRILLPKSDRVLRSKLKLKNKSLSRVTLDQMYCEKMVYAAVAFSFVLVVTIAGVVFGREFQLNNINKVSLTTSAPYTPKQEEALHQIDTTYLKTDNMSEEELRRLLKSGVSDMRETELDEQVRRVVDKKKRVENSVYSWYHFYIAILAGVVGWFVPEAMLLFRNWLIKTESEEDCLQIQTIIGTLMSTSIDTLELLDWLAKHSRVHRHILIDCLHEYPSNPELAISRLKSSASLPQFKHMCDSLALTIDKVDIAEAFSNLNTERDHLMRMRDIAMQQQIKKKRAAMSPVSLIPTIWIVALYFAAPVGIIGVSEFMYTMKNLPM